MEFCAHENDIPKHSQFAVLIRDESDWMKETRKTKRIDVFNNTIYFLLIVILSFILTRTGLIDFKGNDTYIQIGDFNAMVKLKWLLFLVVFGLNGYLHESIHFLTGKIVIPDAKFKITL